MKQIGMVPDREMKYTWMSSIIWRRVLWYELKKFQKMLYRHQRHIRLQREISQKIFPVIVTTLLCPVTRSSVFLRNTNKFLPGLRRYIPDNLCCSWFLFCFHGSTALVDQGILIVKVSRSHSLDAPYSVGLLWTSDRPVAGNSTWQHITLKRNRHLYSRRDSNP